VGYDAELSKARLRSNFVSKDAAVESVYREALAQVNAPEVSFSGYDKERDESQIVALIVGGALVDHADAVDGKTDVLVEVVTRNTCFYGESGGQLGDWGQISTATSLVEVQETFKPVPGLFVHRGKLVRGSLRRGDQVTLAVDVARREATRRNHSATHLLHWALRKVLGAQAQQKGSLVGPERLRFDFTHNSSLTIEQSRQIETRVNEQILINHPITTEVLTMEQARKRGATMIFE